MFKVLKTIQFGEVDRNYEAPITHPLLCPEYDSSGKPVLSTRWGLSALKYSFKYNSLQRVKRV